MEYYLYRKPIAFVYLWKLPGRSSRSSIFANNWQCRESTWRCATWLTYLPATSATKSSASRVLWLVTSTNIQVNEGLIVGARLVSLRLLNQSLRGHYDLLNYRLTDWPLNATIENRQVWDRSPATPATRPSSTNTTWPNIFGYTAARGRTSVRYVSKPSLTRAPSASTSRNNSRTAVAFPGRPARGSRESSRAPRDRRLFFFL